MFLGLITIDDITLTEAHQELTDSMAEPELGILTRAFKNTKTKLPGNRLKLTCISREEAETLGNWKGIPAKKNYTQQPIPTNSLNINNTVM